MNRFAPSAFYAKVINFALTLYVLKLLLTLAKQVKYCTMRAHWIKHDRLTSTNTYLAGRLKDRELQEGCVVIVDYQEAGKGQGSNSWVSTMGENLLMSVLLYPAFLSASKQFHLSRLVSLAICDVLETRGAESHIKWPNDILSRRGKIAGILIEHSITAGFISHTIVGIGMNLNQIDFPSFSVPATSLKLESGKESDVIQVGEQVEDRLQSRYRALQDGSTAGLEQEYLQKLFKAGIPTLFECQDGSFEGIIRGTNDFGELMVERDGEIRAYGHGNIGMKLQFDRS